MRGMFLNHTQSNYSLMHLKLSQTALAIKDTKTSHQKPRKLLSLEQKQFYKVDLKQEKLLVFVTF